MEIFKDIVGYEGLYQVSNLGSVKSLNYNRTGREGLLSPGVNTRGYLIVNLCKNGEQKPFKVHRLVAQAFIPNPLNYPQINHKDENKTNNSVDNLEWCDCQYNIDYSISKPVAQYDLNGNLINVWKSIREAARQLGFDNSSSSIAKCCNGSKRYSTVHNYKWRYI